jgi:adenylosuccinate synthase
MKAYAVIGANYGDEGKGLMTDYLCARHGAEVVVRFNGGAQAGHTVVTPDGRRHVFSHCGSGTYAGAQTYLSQFFVCNPILFHRELSLLGCAPRVVVHPQCFITTPFDMLINQRIEEKRGADRHGSCGVGFNETIVRELAGFSLTAKELGFSNFRYRLRQIASYYFPRRLAELDLEPFDQALIDAVTSDFIDSVAVFKEKTTLAHASYFHGRRTVFEGAQGLLLDQNNMVDFPHLTRSNTGIKNVLALCQEMRIDALEAIYVTRSYLTRHGAGPFPVDGIGPLPDDTNLPHPFQGCLRFGKLDAAALLGRVSQDCLNPSLRLSVGIAVTHCDQVPMPKTLNDSGLITHIASGPTRQEVEESAHMAEREAA